MDGELFDQERKISFAIKAGWKAGKKEIYGKQIQSYITLRLFLFSNNENAKWKKIF